MISAIQPAGMDLIVKISLILITEVGFVNGQYFGLRGAGCRSFDFGFVISDFGLEKDGLRVTGCVL
jgi:hypothetical protein